MIIDAAKEHNLQIKGLQMTASSDEISNSAGSNEIPGDAITQLSTLPITTLFMHVHVLNLGARRLYERQGFKESQRIENFYRRKGPEDKTVKDAWLFEFALPAS